MDNKKLNKEVQNIEDTEQMNNNMSDTTMEDRKKQQISETNSSDMHLDNNASQNNEKTERARKTMHFDMDFNADNIRPVVINGLKILLPVLACVIVIAVIFSYLGKQKEPPAETVNVNPSTNVTTEIPALKEDPLAENAHANVNELMSKFYKALADGDLETVRAIKDYSSDKDLITYEKKSEFIEGYDDIKC